MHFRRVIVVLMLLPLLRTSDAQPSEPDTLSPVAIPYVWQRPVAFTATASSFLLGASPLIFNELHQVNEAFRDGMLAFRQKHFDDRPLHFDNYIQFLPFVSVVGLKVLGVPSQHSELQLLSRCAAGAAIMGLVVLPTKEIISEWRPDHRADNSFPSGHTATAFTGAELVRLEYADFSPLIPVAAYSVAVLTGVMRTYNNRHWASDVLAGAAIGIFAADLSFYLNGRFIDPFLERLTGQRKRPLLPDGSPSVLVPMSE